MKSEKTQFNTEHIIIEQKKKIRLKMRENTHIHSLQNQTNELKRLNETSKKKRKLRSS